MIKDDVLDFSDAEHWIGKTINNIPILEYLPKNEPEKDLELDHLYLDWPEYGLEMVFDGLGQDAVLSSISFEKKNRTHMEMQGERFRGILPRNLSFSLSKSEIINILGLPDMTRGAIFDDLFGEMAPLMKYYLSNDTQLGFEFDGEVILWGQISRAIR